jgi:tetratricopeptide (TPR) repeat protein
MRLLRIGAGAFGAVLLWAAPAAAQATHPVQGAIRLSGAPTDPGGRARLEALVRADPKNAMAAYYLGRIAMVDGNVRDAVRWMERAVALDGGRSDYHRWLGRAYAGQVQRVGRFKQAMLAGKILDAFETAVSLDPANVGARRDLLQFYIVAPGIVGGSMAKAKAQAGAIRARDPALGHVVAGWIAEAERNPAAARREYEAAIAAFPDSGDAYVALGALHERAREYGAAFDAYERLLHRRPDVATAYYQIGYTAAISGERLERGEWALRAYLSRKPADGGPPLAAAHYWLGRIHEHQSRPELARRAYGEALRLDPDHPEARQALDRMT